MTKIGIIGASGQVGTEVCLFLKTYPGVRPVAFVRGAVSGALLKRLGVDLRSYDMTDERGCKQAFGDCDLVADLSVPPGYAGEITAHYSRNIARTLESIDGGARYVFMSSINAFGMNSRFNRAKTYLLPHTLYAYTKRYGERLAVGLGRRLGKEVYIYRLGHVHGLLQRVSEETRLLVRANYRRFEYPDTPAFTIFCHSVAEGLVSTAQGGERPGMYTLISEPAWTWREILEYYAEPGRQIEVNLYPAEPRQRVLGHAIAAVRGGAIASLNDYRETIRTNLLRRLPAMERRAAAQLYVRRAATQIAEFRKLGVYRPEGLHKGIFPGARLKGISDSRAGMAEKTEQVREMLEDVGWETGPRRTVVDIHAELNGAARPEARRRGNHPGGRIAYVQFTNPAGYPPLVHSSRILADAGFETLFLGAEASGAESLRFSPHPRIKVRSLGRQKQGWRQKVHYIYFCCWCLAWILRSRSGWVYASDLFSCPVAAAAAVILRIPLIYHEHDSPAPRPGSRFTRICMWTRKICARRARLCILPNGRRADLFTQTTQSPLPALVIWNCPSLREVAEPRTAERRAMRFLYHGSIALDRLPLQVLDALAALPGEPTLTVVGYETVGTIGHIEALRRRAAALGIETRLNLIGPLSRGDLMEVCRRHDVGLALMPLTSEDLNLRFISGASNKPFDYLSGGLALLVSQLKDWQEMFVNPGYALDCDPGSGETIETAMRWFVEHPEETRAMGEKGRQRILSEWNYEMQFRPALARVGFV